MNKTDLINNEILKKELIERRTEIIKVLDELNKRIRKAPQGSLRLNASHNCDQYIHVKETGNEYIAKKDVVLVTRLAQKDYDCKLTDAFNAQLKAIDRFLKDFDFGVPAKIYDNLNCRRKKLVKPVFLNDEDYIKQWLNAPYAKLGFRKDDPVYNTANGERVRSKSEIMIANELLRYGIPYRYEYPVYSDGVLFAAPDFNCLNVRLRKEYYWEHLGMMGNEEYANKNCGKMEKFLMAQDFDMTKLITTFETDKHPLNIKAVDEIIKRYLL